MCISATSVLIAAPERSATNSAVSSGISSSTSTRSTSSSAYCVRPYSLAALRTTSMITRLSSAENSEVAGQHLPGGEVDLAHRDLARSPRVGGGRQRRHRGEAREARQAPPAAGPQDELAAEGHATEFTISAYPRRRREEKETRGAALAPLVRRQGPALLRPPLAHRADGLRPQRLRGQAGHRHRQHLVGHQPLPHAFPPARRGSEARRLAGGRLSAGDAGDGARRDHAEADHHDVPQLPRHGDRGAAALLPGGRLRADGRLRQDHAGAHHGRDQHEPAGDLPAGRADAEQPLARPDARLGLRHVEVLGRAARRAHHRGATGRASRTRSRARPAPA